MKLFSVIFSISLFSGLAISPAFAGTPVNGAVNAVLIGKLNTYIKQCNAPGADPKPKMAEFVTYLHGHGFKGARIECGVSHYEGTAPLLMIHLADGGEIYVNYNTDKSRARVSEIIEDVNTPQGKKRRQIWPVPKKNVKKKTK
jgi:hypothetical protein